MSKCHARSPAMKLTIKEAFLHAAARGFTRLTTTVVFALSVFSGLRVELIHVISV